jgi:hypothetical protein
VPGGVAKTRYNKNISPKADAAEAKLKINIKSMAQNAIVKGGMK